MALKRPFPAYSGPDKQVFVCYAHADAPTVFPEIQTLHEQGVNIWYDEGIEVGQEWRAEIAEALDRAECVLFYQSRSSSHSRHCVREVSYALNRDIPIIRIDLDGSELPPGLRLGLEVEQAIDPKTYSRTDYTNKLLQALSPSGKADRIHIKQQPPAARLAQWWAVAALLSLALAGGIWWAGAYDSSGDDVVESVPGAPKTIAVLPFEDLSPAADQTYLGMGIADELRLELQQLEGLRVAGRTSSNAYATENSQSIGEKLNVDTLLVGSVRRDGENVRITVQLNDTSDGFTIWSRSYNRKLDRIFEMQEEIATSVARSLGVSLGVGGTNAFRGAGTRNIEAYEAYLQAHALDWSVSGVEEAIPILERAIELDPNYAIAWAELALKRLMSVFDVPVEQAPSLVAEAHRLATRAVELDPESASAYSALGLVQMNQLDWIGAERSLSRSTELLPDFLHSVRYGVMLFRSGRTAASQRQFANAIALEPMDGRPPNPAWHASLAQARFDEARKRSNWQMGNIDRLENNLDIAFNVPDPEAFQEAVLAIAATDLSYVDDEGRNEPLRRSMVSLYEPVLAAVDSPDQVRSILREVYRDEDLQWPRKLHDIGMVAAYFGDLEFALEVKGEEVRINPIRMGGLWYPIMAEVRQLPEFNALVTDLGLVEYWRAYGWADACRPLGKTDFECGSTGLRPRYP